MQRLIVHASWKPDAPVHVGPCLKAAKQTHRRRKRRPRRPPRSCALVLGSGGDGHRDWSEQNGELRFATLMSYRRRL